MPFKSRQAAIILDEFAFALHDVNQNIGLPIDARGEVFSGAGRYGRIAMDQLRHHATHNLDAERQRRNIQQQLVVDGAR